MILLISSQTGPLRYPYKCPFWHNICTHTLKVALQQKLLMDNNKIMNHKATQEYNIHFETRDLLTVSYVKLYKSHISINTTQGSMLRDIYCLILAMISWLYFSSLATKQLIYHSLWRVKILFICTITLLLSLVLWNRSTTDNYFTK